MTKPHRYRNRRPSPCGPRFETHVSFYCDVGSVIFPRISIRHGLGVSYFSVSKKTPCEASQCKKMIPNRIDAGSGLGSVVRDPACCFEWLGAQGTRPSSCPSHTQPFSPRSPLMPSTMPGVQVSGARQQLH